jgi:hypothetical protein
MKDRNPQFGYLPWDQLQPGDAILVPRGYTSLVTLVRHRLGWVVRSTIVGQPEGKRLLIREA